MSEEVGSVVVPKEAHWFYLQSKDGKAQGYFPGENKEEACRKFGYKPSQCKVVEVKITPNGFEWEGKEAEQLRLL